MFRRIFLAMSFFCCIATNSWGDIHTAASCSQSNVQTAINASVRGDTVSVPSGNCTWSNPISVTKGIHIQGAGATSTVITGNTSRFFAVTGDGGDFRMTGFGFTGTASFAGIQIEGNFNSCRFDHLNIANLSNRAVAIGFDSTFNSYYGYRTPYNKQKVLFDHITFSSNSGQQFIMIYGRWQVWAEDDDYGTNNFVFMEDSTFTYNGVYGNNFIDTDGGGRFVFRNNTLKNGSIFQHDFGSSPIRRGGRLQEIYNNILTCTGIAGCEAWPAIAQRGGSGVYYNNTISGYSTSITSQIYRVDYNHGYIGGGHCSQTGSLKACADFQKHCSAGTHLSCYDNGDCVGNGTCDADYFCSSDSDCGPVKCIQIDGSGGNGYPCRDQTGRGKDDPTTGVQASCPVYWWNNGGTSFSGSKYPIYTKENRDYCNHSPATACGSKAAWTYTPYTYPHPLQTGSVVNPVDMPIQPPKNVLIISP